MLHGAKFIHQYNNEPYCDRCLVEILSSMTKDDLENCIYCDKKMFDWETLGYLELNEARQGQHVIVCEPCGWKRYIGL